MTAKSLEIPDPNRVVHRTVSSWCTMLNWKTVCGLDLNRVSLDVRVDDRWRRVTCKNCRRLQPKR